MTTAQTLAHLQLKQQLQDSVALTNNRPNGLTPIMPADGSVIAPAGHLASAHRSPSAAPGLFIHRIERVELAPVLFAANKRRHRWGAQAGTTWKRRLKRKGWLS